MVIHQPKGTKYVSMREVLSLYSYLIIARALREIQYYQSEVMDGCYLIGKLNFSRLVREIAKNVTIGGAEHRFEQDALVALQMAMEHIMIMIFELMYHIPSPGVVDYRNKLAIHAKHVTIQPKDMSLLRELWHSIDPMSPIGDPTSEKAVIARATRIEGARQAKGVWAALKSYNRLRRLGQTIPVGLKNFLKAHDHL